MKASGPKSRITRDNFDPVRVIELITGRELDGQLIETQRLLEEACHALMRERIKEPIP